MNLHSISTTQESIQVRWQASTDNVGVVSYEVSRDGIKFVTVLPTTLTVIDKGLPAGKIFSYQVTAVDAAGNRTSSTIFLGSTKALPATDSGMSTITWSHPTFRESGDYLDWIEIGGYEIRYKKPTDATFTYISIPGNEVNEYLAPKGTFDGCILEIAAYDVNGLYSKFVSIEAH